MMYRHPLVLLPEQAARQAHTGAAPLPAAGPVSAQGPGPTIGRPTRPVPWTPGPTHHPARSPGQRGCRPLATPAHLPALNCPVYGGGGDPVVIFTRCLFIKGLACPHVCGAALPSLNHVAPLGVECPLEG